MKKCGYCQADIFDNVIICPYCKREQSSLLKKCFLFAGLGLLVVIGVLVMFGVGFWAGTGVAVIGGLLLAFIDIITSRKSRFIN